MLHNSHIFEVLSIIFYPICNSLGMDDKFVEGFFTGIVELTNGVKQICSIPCKNLSNVIILNSFLLGFGGFSVLLQVLSITSKSKISIKPYIIGKLLHGVLAAIYTFLILENTYIFNLNI